MSHIMDELSDLLMHIMLREQLCQAMSISVNEEWVDKCETLKFVDSV